MKKIFIFILSIVPVICYGQIDINKAFEALKQAKTEKSIVESSLVPELSIIRQQYRLARDGKTYGKDNKPYYGETYSLGIKISNGMILPVSAVEPWKNDEAYKTLNTSDQYKPEIFWTYQRMLEGTEYNKIDLELGTEYIHPLDSTLYIHEEQKGDFGLTVDNTPGEKVGYMVWVYSNTNLQDSAMTVSIRQNAMTLMASEDSATVALDVNDAEKILGGLFVVPKYERGGRIQMLIAGAATPVAEQKKWNLILFAKGKIEEKNNSAASEDVNKGNNSSEPTLIDSPQDVSRKKDKKKKK